MHLTKRTFAAILVAGALFSQTPVLAHADEGTSVSHSSCHMSRNVNGARWSSSDCGEVRQQMSEDLANFNSMLEQLSLPDRPAAVAPVVSEPSVDADPITAHILDSISAFIQHLFFGLSWF